MKQRKLLLLISMLIGIIFILDAKNEILEPSTVEVAQIGHNGTVVLKVWCVDKKNKIDNDRYLKSAVYELLFSGVQDSERIKGRKPLVQEGFDVYSDYFTSFFSENRYSSYARISVDGYVNTGNIMKIGKKYKIAKIVVVDIDRLRKQLEQDNIIKPLNYGF